MTKRQITGVLVYPFIALVLSVFYLFNAPGPTALETVLETGKLHVLTRNAPTTYYQGPFGPAGIEYDLLKQFADSLGVELVLETTDNLKELLDRTASGEVNIAAAGLTVTDERKKQVRFTPPYQEITQQLIYNVTHRRPRTLADLQNGNLEVIANSSHVELLNQLQQEQPQLKWSEDNTSGSSEMLQLVAEQVIDYTIADSNEVKLNRRYYPQLRIAFDVSKPQPLAWAMPKSEDDSLYRKAEAFFKRIKKTGELARLVKKNYGHMRRYDYAGTPTYMRHTRARLPRYQSMFEHAAETHQLDWRLLAAMAYQESHWNPRAVSPTGVRGMMMLTKKTARDLGVEKRTDTKQSINGGARYFTMLLEQLADIPEPDRTWFALAAYNVGLGHVRDAQSIAVEQGMDPNTWTNIKETLPLLTKRKWYRKTRFGYARGYEPVRYVENIRSYYDILRWQIEREQPYRAPRSITAFASPAL